MLRNLHISRFKCFQQLDLELGPLTLLSGVNGGGKSSVIQSLVLLSQTLSEREWGRTLLLEGPELALGSAADVLNQNARDSIAFGASTSTERLQWTFKAVDRRALSVELESMQRDGQEVPLSEPIRWLLPVAQAEASSVVSTLRRLSWITAERTGPRELLPLRDERGHQHVGSRGELAAGLLHWRKDETVREELCIQGQPPTLLHQLKAHMQEFFPHCDLRVVPIDGASAVSLQLKPDHRSDFQRPQNVGFGLTQLFPILVAVLAAKKGDVLLIENPEVHLHPKAQQDIGLLLAKVAASGVQVIVETHADHVLNGVRLAVKTKTINHHEISIHFFGKSDGTCTPTSPQIDADGRLNSWPEGFFDQFDQALSQLL
jgi:predicted ATPase